MKNKRTNLEIVLKEHPMGVPTKDIFGLNDIEIPNIEKGQVLLKTLYISVDPGMRGFMDKGENDAAGLKYELNKPITSRSVAQVIESKSDNFSKGTIVYGRLAWQKYQAFEPSNLQRVDPKLAPIATALSLLGVTGLAAYFGIMKIGQPQKGETVVVSGAAGAVGSVAVQIAKLYGCRVLGIAGSDEKIDYLENDLGIYKGINYKKVVDMNKAIKEACPDGVDMFFDNVGGEIFDAVFENINRHARIVICGQISEYNNTNSQKGPRPLHKLIKSSARMEGFVVFDFKDEFESAKKQLGDWYNTGKMKHRENLILGFENVPSAFIGLFTGENIGKQIIKVAEVEEI